MPLRTILLLAAIGLLLAGCRTPPLPVDEGPQIQPYFDYFEAYTADGTFLFANLRAKQAFDLNREAVEFEPYVTLDGRRIYIDRTDPELVDPIRVGFEQRLDLEIMPLDPLRPGEAEGELAPDPPEPPQAPTGRRSR